MENGQNGWTIINNGGDCDWESNASAGIRTNNTGGSGDCAIADSDTCGRFSTMDTELRTPEIDLFTASSAALEFKSDYYNFFGEDFAYVDISTDGGSFWTNLLTWNSSRRGPDLIQIDITPYVGSLSTVIRFRYYAPGWDWWWEIDDVTIISANEDCQGPLNTYYADTDGDGYGDQSDTTEDCTQPAGYVSNNTDCDDAEALVNPGASEICGNGIDDNCDGTVDEGCGGGIGLMAHYAFEGNADDSSGSGNHGTVNGGAAWTAAGKVGGALDFDGVDDYVGVGDIDLTDAFTIAAWIKLSSTGKYMIVGKSFGTYQFFVSPTGGLVFQRNSSTPMRYNAGLVTDAWYHVAVTFNTNRRYGDVSKR